MKKLIFVIFLMYELQDGFRMVLKPKNNYRFLKHIFLPFQLYIASQYMKKLIFCHFLMYELQNGFRMVLKPKCVCVCVCTSLPFLTILNPQSSVFSFSVFLFFWFSGFLVFYGVKYASDKIFILGSHFSGAV